jgi:hypothetical protein
MILYRMRCKRSVIILPRPTRGDRHNSACGCVRRPADFVLHTDVSRDRGGCGLTRLRGEN